MSRETVRDHNDWQAAEAWHAIRDYIPEEIDCAMESKAKMTLFPQRKTGHCTALRDQDCPPDSQEDRR